MAELRAIAVPFVASGPRGVAIRTRVRLTPDEEKTFRLVGGHLGSLAGRDLAQRCRDGLEHDGQKWAARKQGLTGESSSRWAGSMTKGTHDQWALARRCQAAHLDSLDAGIRMIRHRLSLPVGEPATKRAPGGYRSRQEWFGEVAPLGDVGRSARSCRRRPRGRDRARRARGKKLANSRHNLDAANLTGRQWRDRWDAARMFLTADGESGKRYGNETIRVATDGAVSIKLPTPFAHHANDKHGRYTLTVSWQPPATLELSLDTALACGVIGVDTNNDHYAAWLLDTHGNPVGEPRRFDYDMRGSADRRDAQIRHATTRLLHWAKRCGVNAIAIENLDFTDGKTREKHGRSKSFRQLISRFPAARLRSRLVSMAAETGIAIVAVDPAYTSRWGAEHWAKPTSTPTRKTTRKTTRHEAASLVIGRRAQGHHARRRTPPPPRHQSDDMRYRSAQAGQGNFMREEPRPPRTGTRTRSAHPPGT